ncbi:hypothetical protein ALC53_06317, partial [Atta colombica]
TLLKQKDFSQVMRQLCESFVLQQKSYHFIVRIDRTVSGYFMRVGQSRTRSGGCNVKEDVERIFFDKWLSRLKRK